MSEPIDLGAARAKRDAGVGGENVCCECGSEWWTTSVVIEKATDRVVGYAADMVCADCGATP